MRQTHWPEFLDVLRVAGDDTLWLEWARSLHLGANVFLNDEQAREAMSRHFVGDGSPVDPLWDEWIKTDVFWRRTIVAWTWPNVWGTTIETHTLAIGTDGEPFASNAAQLVRDRVSEQAKQIVMHHGDAVRALRRAMPDMYDWFMLIRAGRRPIVVTELQDFSTAMGLSFQPTRKGSGPGAWHHVRSRAQMLESMGEFRVDPDGPLAHALQTFASVMALIDGRAAVTTDAIAFHESLPKPPHEEAKYYPLFKRLDGRPDADWREVVATTDEIDSWLDGATGTRGRKVPGLPAAAVNTPAKWWSNTPPLAKAERISDRMAAKGGGYVRRAASNAPQAVAWLAAGYTVSTRTTSAGVVEITFTPMPGRKNWFQHRKELRAGNYASDKPRARKA